MRPRVIHDTRDTRGRTTLPLALASARGITCDVAMRIRNNAILACRTAAVCTLGVACFCLQSTSRAASYHRHTVTQFHVEAEHSSKQRCSMGYPSSSSQASFVRMRMIYASLAPRGPVLQFVSPGSLSLLAFVVRRPFDSSSAPSVPLHVCVCRMRRFSCISLCSQRLSRATSARTARWHVRVCKRAAAT